MSTTETRLARNLAHVIAEQAGVDHVSYAEALTAFRLDLGQKLAAAMITADEFSLANRPQAWVDGELDAARRYASELLAIADFTEADIRVIVALGAGR